MENKIDNIITICNLIEVTRAVVKAVGYDYQAPLEDAVLDEVISSQIMKLVLPSQSAV